MSACHSGDLRRQEGTSVSVLDSESALRAGELRVVDVLGNRKAYRGRKIEVRGVLRIFNYMRQGHEMSFCLFDVARVGTLKEASELAIELVVHANAEDFDSICSMDRKVVTVDGWYTGGFGTDTNLMEYLWSDQRPGALLVEQVRLGERIIWRVAPAKAEEFRAIGLHLEGAQTGRN